MTYAFDLISDLFQTDTNQIDFKFKQSSPIAVVAGNIAADREVLLSVLTNLSSCYTQVFFIDGFYEHYGRWDNIPESLDEIEEICAMFDNVMFLQDRVIISEGVAFIGTNGWWDYCFAPSIEPEQARVWHKEKHHLNDADVDMIISMAWQDAMYLYNSVARLQKHGDVKDIVIVTNSVPEFSLLEHDPEYSESYRAAVIGNSMMSRVNSVDTENKVKVWNHGMYRSGIVESRNHTRYYNNPMKKIGHADHIAYSPKRIVL